MNVFLESHNITNRAGGLGSFNYHLIKAIAKQNLKQLDITLNLKDKSKLENEFGSIFKYEQYTSLERHWLFRKKTKYDVWHSLNQNTKVEPFFTPKKYILTVHDVNFVEEISTNLNHKVNKLFIEKIKRADVITYISEFAKKQTHQYFDTLNKPELVIYNGNPNDEILDLTNMNISINKPFFFALGDFIPRKNFESLINMMEFIEDINLIIGGNHEKEYGIKIKNLIKEKKLENKITLIGKIDDYEKQFYMKNCEAFLFPSIREGFGLPPIEAMAFEKPVFLSNLTSLPEIGADAAFYWEHFDPIYMKNFLFDNLNEFNNNSKEWKNKIKKRAEFFTWEKAAHEYIKLYTI